MSSQVNIFHIVPPVGLQINCSLTWITPVTSAAVCSFSFSDAIGLFSFFFGIFAPLSYWDFFIFSGPILISLTLILWISWYLANLEVPETSSCQSDSRCPNFHTSHIFFKMRMSKQAGVYRVKTSQSVDGFFSLLIFVKFLQRLKKKETGDLKRPVENYNPTWLPDIS